MRKLAVAAFAVALGLAGCTGSKTEVRASVSAGPPTAAGATTASETPSPVASAAFTVGAEFYADTFADSSKGWATTETERAKYAVHPEYATPLFTVTAKQGDTQLFPHPSFRGVPKERLRDYQVTATLQSTLAVGQEDWLGVTCRDLSDKRYTFQVHTDLTTHTAGWRIAKHEGSRMTVLAEGDSGIGGSAWDVSGTCFTATDGSAWLVMGVNGQEVARTRDGEAPLVEGYAGVYLLAHNGRATINVLRFGVKSVTAA